MPFSRKNFVTGRFEWSQRDELFDYDHDLAHEIEQETGKRSFNVSALTLGTHAISNCSRTFRPESEQTSLLTELRVRLSPTTETIHGA